jgi:hypothetical protein
MSVSAPPHSFPYASPCQLCAVPSPLVIARHRGTRHLPPGGYTCCATTTRMTTVIVSVAEAITTGKTIPLMMLAMTIMSTKPKHACSKIRVLVLVGEGVRILTGSLGEIGSAGDRVASSVHGLEVRSSVPLAGRRGNDRETRAFKLVEENRMPSPRGSRSTRDRTSSLICGLKVRSCALHGSSNVSVKLTGSHDGDDCGDTRALDLVGVGETRSSRGLEHTSDRMSSLIHGLKSRSSVPHESSDVSVPLDDDCGDN